MMYSKNRICPSIFLAGITIVSLQACESFLEIPPPNSRVVSETVFNNPETAVAALNGLYQSLSTGYASGHTNSIGVYGGLSADELDFTNTGLSPKIDIEEINNNDISHTNSSVRALWVNCYSVIYGVNSILERVENNSGLGDLTAQALKGEAYFIRAFTYFYLANMFGSVPLILNTNYRDNAIAQKANVETIYSQIMADPKAAIELLSTVYPEDNRLRVNKWVAEAFMARVFLYTGNFAEAEASSEKVISQDQMYGLEHNLDNVFLAQSKEALWQKAHLTPNSNAAEASMYLQGDEYFLNEALLSSFHIGDGRLSSWVTLKESGSAGFVPYKYKSTSASVTTEHSINLRLAEQYLIRAEARIRMGKRMEAIDDLDEIRMRAGLLPIKVLNPNISAEALFDSLMVERQRELFTEWGHRWLDLKRTGRATGTLTTVKPGFTTEDEWYPIPESEVLLNPNLNK